MLVFIFLIVWANASRKAHCVRKQSSHFEHILQKAAYNLEGGFKDTGLIESYVIDHYIPFLPLEKGHVFRCIKEEFLKWNKRPKDETINQIIEDSIIYDRTHGLFATSGCKTIEKKVAVAAWASGQ